jgi:hypothetical protein
MRGRASNAKHNIGGVVADKILGGVSTCAHAKTSVSRLSEQLVCKHGIKNKFDQPHRQQRRAKQVVESIYKS